jgi:hypothetical protein
MWCFIDESWHKAENEHIGVLAAAIGKKAEFADLGKFLYGLRKKYYGESHARDLKSELKGSNLFSNQSFKKRSDSYSINLAVGRELIEWVTKSEIRFVGVCVYGEIEPPLLTPNLKSLSMPFRELCVRIHSHVPVGQSCQLIFDQRLGAQENISIAVHNYLAGIREPHLLVPHPFIGVSNVWPGLQLADIAAHILGRYGTGDERFTFWYKKIKALQTDGKDHNRQRVFGFLRLQWIKDDIYQPRRIRTKK